MRQVGILAAAGLHRAARRRRRHDRPARRGSRARASPCRSDGRDGRHHLAGPPRPAGTRAASIPARVTTNFVLFGVERDREAFLAGARGARRLVRRLSARPGPRRAALRHHRGRHRHVIDAVARGAARDGSTGRRPGRRTAEPDGPQRRRADAPSRSTARAWPSPTDDAFGPTSPATAAAEPVATSTADAPTHPAGGPVTAPDRTSVALTRPTSDQPGAARRAVLRPRGSAVPAAAARPPAVRDVRRHPHRRRPTRRRHRATRSSRRWPQERAHLSAVEAIDPAGLSETARFERDLEIHNLRRQHLRRRGASRLGAPVHGHGQRRRRDLRALRPRLRAAARAAGRRSSAASRRRRGTSRSTRPAPRSTPVRLWQQLEIEAAEDMPGLFDEVIAAGAGVLVGRRSAPPGAVPPTRRKQAVGEYADWLHESLAHAVDDWPLGRRRVRRADRAARLRRPRRRHDPRDRRGAAGQEQGSARRRGAGDRPDRRRADRRRPHQARPPGHVRGGARGVPRRHAPRAPAPHRATTS